MLKLMDKKIIIILRSEILLNWTYTLALQDEVPLTDMTYVVGAQKNRLNETVLLSIPNICLNRLLMDKKIIII